jgi:hypothetical protein
MQGLWKSKVLDYFAEYLIKLKSALGVAEKTIPKMKCTGCRVDIKSARHRLLAHRSSIPYTLIALIVTSWRFAYIF